MGSSTVTEGGTANYTVSYTGATLAPGQVMTIVVGSNGGFDSNPTMRRPAPTTRRWARR